MRGRYSFSGAFWDFHVLITSFAIDVIQSLIAGFPRCLEVRLSNSAGFKNDTASEIDGSQLSQQGSSFGSVSQRPQPKFDHSQTDSFVVTRSDHEAHPPHRHHRIGSNLPLMHCQLYLIGVDEAMIAPHRSSRRIIVGDETTILKGSHRFSVAASSWSTRLVFPLFCPSWSCTSVRPVRARVAMP